MNEYRLKEEYKYLCHCWSPYSFLNEQNRLGGIRSEDTAVNETDNSHNAYFKLWGEMQQTGNKYIKYMT